jgi:hypothetical protein
VTAVTKFVALSEDEKTDQNQQRRTIKNDVGIAAVFHAANAHDQINERTKLVLQVFQIVHISPHELSLVSLIAGPFSSKTHRLFRIEKARVLS